MAADILEGETVHSEERSPSGVHMIKKQSEASTDSDVADRQMAAMRVRFM